MAGVDEGDETLRPPVGRVHRVLADAVVTPTLLAGKIRDGHHLDGPHPEIHQVIQVRDGRLEGALRGEGADVQLVADRAPQVRAEGDGTVEQRRIDDATRPVRAFGLAEAPWVGQRHPAVDPELVQRPGRQRFRPPPAAVAASHDRLGAIDDDLHRVGVGGPHLGTGDVSHECSSDQDSGCLLALTRWSCRNHGEGGRGPGGGFWPPGASGGFDSVVRWRSRAGSTGCLCWLRISRPGGRAGRPAGGRGCRPVMWSLPGTRARSGRRGTAGWAAPVRHRPSPPRSVPTAPAWPP